MRIDCSNEPSRVQRAGVRVLWGLAVLACLPALGVFVYVVSDVLRWHQLPPFYLREAPILVLLLAAPVLSAFAAEGLRRATRWAAGLASTVAVGAGVLVALPILPLLANLSEYDDVRRKQVAAMIGLASLSAAMFKLAAGVVRCGPHLEEVRGQSVRAFEPVMGVGRPADEPRGGQEAS